MNLTSCVCSAIGSQSGQHSLYLKGIGYPDFHGFACSIEQMQSVYKTQRWSSKVPSESSLPSNLIHTQQLFKSKHTPRNRHGYDSCLYYRKYPCLRSRRGSRTSSPPHDHIRRRRRQRMSLRRSSTMRRNRI